MAAEAVEEALIGYDREGCRLLVMERAAPPVAIAPALKRDVALHDAHDVCVLAHALDEGVHRLIPHSFQLIPSSRPPLEPDGTHRSDTLVYSLSSGKNLLRADKKLVQPLDKVTGMHSTQVFQIYIPQKLPISFFIPKISWHTAVIGCSG